MKRLEERKKGKGGRRKSQEREKEKEEKLSKRKKRSEESARTKEKCIEVLGEEEEESKLQKGGKKFQNLTHLDVIWLPGAARSPGTHELAPCISCWYGRSSAPRTQSLLKPAQMAVNATNRLQSSVRVARARLFPTPYLQIL